MQILTSGSFVNLDNGEKIEQLIFTAKAIAESAIETDGFQSDEEKNKRLALEIWQGAEYMTREHERGRIQNIFVEEFLERLREIAPAAPAAVNVLPPENFECELVESNNRNDEFLGYITSAEDNKTQAVAVENDAFAAEDTQETKPVEIFPEINEPAARIFQNENSEKETAKSFESLTNETVEDQMVQTENNEAVEPKEEIENSIVEVSQFVRTEKPVISAITLPEKEPYRWDDCTVTATIQLLPVETEIRRAVISVRTHDFAPQISVIELVGAATPENIAPALQRAFERYQTDLPVKVMDKMKREKSAGKKHLTKTTIVPKTDSPNTNQTAGSQLKIEPQPPQTSVVKTENNQTAASAGSQTVSAQTQSIIANRSKTNVKTSKPEDNKQGNLFGF